MDDDDRALRFSALYRANPDKALTVWLNFIEQEAAKAEPCFPIIGDAKLCLDARISGKLIEVLGRLKSSKAMLQALHAVRELSQALAKQMVEVWWRRVHPEDVPDAEDFRQAIFLCVLWCGDDALREQALARLEQDDVLARAVWRWFTSSSYVDGRAPGWTPTQIRRMGVMLWKLFPRKDDPPEPAGGYEVTREHEVARMRNCTASMLATIATQDADRTPTRSRSRQLGLHHSRGKSHARRS